MGVRPSKGSSYVDHFGLGDSHQWYDLHSMKQKTSITLSPEALEAVDRIAGPDSNRSRVIERAIQELAARLRREEREARDLQILNRVADGLNEEMKEVLTHQVDR